MQEASLPFIIFLACVSVSSLTVYILNIREWRYLRGLRDDAEYLGKTSEVEYYEVKVQKQVKRIERIEYGLVGGVLGAIAILYLCGVDVLKLAGVVLW